MADVNQILDLLRSFPFLADQPDQLLQTLAVQGQLLRFNLGQPISRLDQAPPQVFFLLQGTVRSVVMAQRFAKELLPAFADGRFRPVLDRRFPLAEIGAAHDYVATNANVGKVVIDI